MESIFIEFLTDNFGYCVMVVIAACVVLIPILIRFILFCIKKWKAHEKKIEERMKKAEDEQKFHESVTTIADNVTTIQNSIQEMYKEQAKHQEEISTKLNDVWDAIERQQRESRIGDTALEKRIQSYENTISEISEKITSMDEKQTLLIESDKESIQSEITQEYYRSIKRKYIELHTLQVLESRYVKYLQENGNTFIAGLMYEMRALPHTPPENETTDEISHDIEDV